MFGISRKQAAGEGVADAKRQFERVVKIACLNHGQYGTEYLLLCD
jgi:hypothetical protein